MEKSSPSEDKFWKKLVENYYPLVVSVARKVAPRSSQAVDIAQQVFYEFYAKHATLCDHETNVEGLRPLLYEFAKRIAMREWREAKRKTPESLQKVGEILLKHYEQRSEEHGREIDDDYDEKQTALKDCLETLSEKSRQMIASHYFDGTSIKELARKNEATENAVYKALKKIRLQLRHCIDKKMKKK